MVLKIIFLLNFIIYPEESNFAFTYQVFHISTF